MGETPSYRTLAERALDSAAAELRAIPNGQVPTPVFAAHMAKTQALATVAVAQALLHIGDLLATHASEEPK